jgi:hypothetical protein
MEIWRTLCWGWLASMLTTFYLLMLYSTLGNIIQMYWDCHSRKLSIIFRRRPSFLISLNIHQLLTTIIMHILIPYYLIHFNLTIWMARGQCPSSEKIVENLTVLR